MQNHLARPNLTELLVSSIRDMIVAGRLPAGDRLNEVHLATALGVSRTPLREALNRLVTEGALRAQPRIGYFVKPLTVEEFQQIYPIRALLDPEALRLSGLPNGEQLDRLVKINERIKKAKSANDRIELDDAWHRELIRRCPNKVLLDLIDQFIKRTRRYEIAFMRDTRNVDISTSTHDRITAALKRKKLDQAADILRANMQQGLDPIIEWLRSRAK
jgi:DNA-binding GntR family transcriptional regulator